MPWISAVVGWELIYFYFTLYFHFPIHPGLSCTTTVDSKGPSIALGGGTWPLSGGPQLLSVEPSTTLGGTLDHFWGALNLLQPLQGALMTSAAPQL